MANIVPTVWDITERVRHECWAYLSIGDQHWTSQGKSLAVMFESLGNEDDIVLDFAKWLVSVSQERVWASHTDDCTIRINSDCDCEILNHPPGL